MGLTYLEILSVGGIHIAPHRDDPVADRKHRRVDDDDDQVQQPFPLYWNVSYVSHLYLKWIDVPWDGLGLLGDLHGAGDNVVLAFDRAQAQLHVLDHHRLRRHLRVVHEGTGKEEMNSVASMCNLDELYLELEGGKRLHSIFSQCDTVKSFISSHYEHTDKTYWQTDPLKAPPPNFDIFPLSP